MNQSYFTYLISLDIFTQEFNLFHRILIRKIFWGQLDLVMKCRVLSAKEGPKQYPLIIASEEAAEEEATDVPRQDR